MRLLKKLGICYECSEALDTKFIISYGEYNSNLVEPWKSKQKIAICKNCLNKLNLKDD